MPNSSDNLDFNLPIVGSDVDVWGGYLNENWEKLDALLSGDQTITTEPVFTNLTALGDLSVGDGELVFDVSQSRLRFDDGSVQTDILADGGGAIIRTATNHRIVFRTNNTNALMIGNNQRISVGQLSADYLFDVNGSIRAKETLISTGASFGSNENHLALVLAADNYDGNNSNWGRHGYQFRLRSDGSGAGRLSIETSARDNLLCIFDTGFVGVRKSIANFALDVNGDIHADNDVLAGRNVVVAANVAWGLGNDYIRWDSGEGLKGFENSSLQWRLGDDFRYNGGAGKVMEAFGVRAWSSTRLSGGRNGSGNIASVNRTSTGLYEYTFDDNMSDNDYAVTVTVANALAVANVGNKTSSGFFVSIFDLSFNTVNEDHEVMVVR